MFPLSIGLSRLYDFLWGLLVLLIVLVATRMQLSWYALWMVPLILVQLILVVGIAYFVAYLGAFFADTANITTVVLRLGFYGSPILYYIHGKHTRIPEWVLPYYMLNPIACLLEGYRAGLAEQRMPDPWQLLYVFGCALIVLIVGYGLFSRGEGKFAKYV